MPTVTLSSRGQIVIPAEVRREMGLSAGDRLTLSVSEDGSVAQLRRKETLDEMSARFRSYIKPGTPPLMDVHGFYDQRPPRL